ncbi:BTB And C-terminal Kelch [Desmophyllum pertusum]|uniref:BTB And C-terminal Kelch n=1 Tax=Desmophyllum pertusum TaxID=174260 RepID=A0A9W9YPP3_9CNID|nr:BTB And C-terminal Kelch [Desmophyllum pertusum]
MAARSDPIENYCDNIKVYHEKKEEEQFYDFTIKDKDGIEIRSHKFLLASQSKYFAALFRRDPTASETTFEDFSLDAIKKCIDYLYIHESDLTGNNVQDLLMFADYINLTDVTEICTNYIIKNIDQSNYAHVIELGNTRGMVKLVEAGVLFAARNMRRRNIICLDEFFKAMMMIIKVATWQQKQITVMTGEQWFVNRLKTYFLSSPEDKVAFQVRCSSVYQDRPTPVAGGEVTFSCPDLVRDYRQSSNGCRERLRNVEIRAGMEPVPEGFTAQERGHNASKKLKVNSRCGFFAGPADRFIMEGHLITFNQPTLAQYITLQILEVEYLQINGIKINGGDLLNCEDYF